MKKINILLFLSLCYSFSQAQISFTRADMPPIGWVDPQQQDTIRNAVAAVNFGSKGANQVYNFSTLQHQVLDSVYYYAPSTTQPSGNPQHTAVPGANLAAFFPPTTYLMADDTTNFFAYDGLQATVFNSTVISNYSYYRGIDTMYKFPCTYGQNFRGTYAGSVKILADSVSSNAGLLGWDSIKVYIGATYTDTIDGWGTVTTPVGTYKCLRQKRVETDSTYYYYNSSANGPYTMMPLTVTVLFTTYTILAANPAISTTTSYSYLAKEAKGPVISFSYDSISQPITATWSALPPFPVAKFTADTGAAGLLTLLDSSSNATTYSWNFGDGTALNSNPAPTHTYTANGTYNVCLTVSNASGTSTVCDSVHVTNINMNIPVAQITPSGVDSVCPGVSVILRAQTSAGYTFKWSNNATADSIIVTAGGSYTVKVYHNGDSATSSPTVVVVRTPSDNVTNAGTLLTSQTETHYQWYKGSTLLTGDTSKTLTATQSGAYTVHFTDANGCTGISNSVTITVGINEINPSDYRIYPNPASDVIQLDLTHVDESTLNNLSEIVVYDLLGEKMRSLPITPQTTISVKDLSNGIYLIGVLDKNQNRKILGKFDVLK